MEAIQFPALLAPNDEFAPFDLNAFPKEYHGEEGGGGQGPRVPCHFDLNMIAPEETEASEGEGPIGVDMNDRHEEMEEKKSH